jgi:hypothetical protein
MKNPKKEVTKCPHHNKKGECMLEPPCTEKPLTGEGALPCDHWWIKQDLGSKGILCAACRVTIPALLAQKEQEAHQLGYDAAMKRIESIINGDGLINYDDFQAIKSIKSNNPPRDEHETNPPASRS